MGLRDQLRHLSLRAGNSATVDVLDTESLTLLLPIDLSNDAAVTEVLDLAIGVGQVLLDNGTGAVDTEAQVGFVAAAYGLGDTEVDVTFNSISVVAHRGSSLPPVAALRVVHHRAHDFTRLAEVDRLIRAIGTGRVRPQRGARRLKEINSAPHPYPRWASGAGWALMAGAFTMMLGGHPVSAMVSTLSGAVTFAVNGWFRRRGLPLFFQQAIGGFIATIPAALLYRYRDSLGLDMRPAELIAAGVMVLLSGLALVGSVQDAITGAPVTAAGRMIELFMATGGIVAGVGLAIRLTARVDITLPALGTDPQLGLANFPVVFIAGGIASAAFALASYAERPALWVALVSGAVGAAVDWLLLYLDFGPVVAAGTAAAIIGFVGGLLARRALVPPLIVAVAGITPLLPGLAVYRGLSAALGDHVLAGIVAITSAAGIGVALAAGVTLGEWLARTVKRPRKRISRTLDTA